MKMGIAILAFANAMLHLALMIASVNVEDASASAAMLFTLLFAASVIIAIPLIRDVLAEAP